jgi:hypothetical protein
VPYAVAKRLPQVYTAVAVEELEDTVGNAEEPEGKAEEDMAVADTIVADGEARAVEDSIDVDGSMLGESEDSHIDIRGFAACSEPSDSTEACLASWCAVFVAVTAVLGVTPVAACEAT